MFAVYVVLCGFTLQISEASASPESIFDKFQQNDFKIKFEHVDVASYDKTAFKRLELVNFKYNRTCAVLNTTYELNINLDYATEVIVQAYKFASNEYRLFPLRFQVNACHALSKNLAGTQNLYNCGNYTGCPLKKGKLVRICNWTIDESKFPPIIPNGRYMVDMHVLFTEKEIALIKCYVEVFRPISITK